MVFEEELPRLLIDMLKRVINTWVIPREKSSFLQYLDVNNLYGWAMIQPLPTGGFNWVDVSESMPDKINSYANCDSEGYLLEVAVKYPKELHDSHNDLPLMCEKMVINRVEKLVPNLHNNKNYQEKITRRVNLKLQLYL